MDDYADKAHSKLYGLDAAFDKTQSHEGFSTKENDTQELEGSLQILTEVDFRLAYSSEKLVNLHVLYIYLLARENDLETMDSENNCTPTDLYEKALTFDLLSGFLDSEVRELDNFMDTLQAEIVDARHKIFSCRHLTEVFFMMEEKLHDSEESVKQFQQQLLELKMQSSKLHRTLVAFQHDNRGIGKAMILSENGQLMDIKAKSNGHMVEQQRFILRMLEKSLARELDLEKKLAESRKNEELRLKLHYTEQVALRMEEAAEVIWVRFLEADNATEVLMGISKDLMGCLQIAEFNLNGSFQRENELKSKLQNFMDQIKAKDLALEKFKRSNAEHIKECAEVLALREQVKLLEVEKMDFELRLNAALAENEANQEQLMQMENYTESLKESIFIAETQAESAEAKANQLAEANLELTEELNFLKGSASTAEKRVGTLEKQLRELEIQLQNAKASSEASQEQLNMLYSAIWDMEILIEDLKSKVSKAESNTDSAEEKCILLSENNFELKKELDLLRSQVTRLETSLDQANNSKISSAKEINSKTNFIMDMVKQLAIEREHIHKQICNLRKENNRLVEKLKITRRDVPLDACDNRLNEANEDRASNADSSNGSCTKSSDEDRRDPFDKTYQVGETSEDATSETQVGSSISEKKSAKCSSLKFLFVAIIVPLLSVLAMSLFDKKTLIFLKTLDG